MTAKKACKIRMDGVYYTREEWDNVPLTVKLKALLQSPNLEKYMKLGASRLKNGGVFTEVPVAQGAYDNAKSELSRVLDHAKTIRQKIKDVFGKHMDEKQVEYGLIMLDTMAHAWSDRTGQLKELYYERYQDVQQTTTDNLIDRDNILNQIIGVKGVQELERNLEETLKQDMLSRAIQMEELLGVTNEDWATRNNNEENRLKIKIATGWEKDRSGNWVYEILDGEVLEIPEKGKYLELQQVYKNDELYKAYPTIAKYPVTSYYQDNGVRGYVDGKMLFLNLKYTNNDNRTTIGHEIQHFISDIEGFEPGGNVQWFVSSIERIIGQIQSGNGESSLMEGDRYVLREINSVHRNGIAFLRTATEGDILKLGTQLYYSLEGEITSYNVEDRMNMSESERRNSLLSKTEVISREYQISKQSVENVRRQNSEFLGTGNIAFQIIGEKGVVNLSDSVNRLQNLQLAKRMLSQGVPMGVIKRLTSWEQDDDIWKTETDDLWDFTVKRMPKQETESTLGELIGDAEVFEAYPQIKDIQIKFDNYDGYFSASYEPALNTITVNKQYITNLRQLKSSLVHEMQHAVQEIEGWQQGTNPEDVGSQENYRNAVGEVEARNASTRMDLTDQDKLESVLQDTADVALEDRIYIENITELAARTPTSIQQSMTVFHGSLYNFDRFSTDNIRTGEGNNTFGWGLYFTNLEEIALDYANKLGTEGNRNFYEVSLHEGKTPSEYTWLVWNQTIPRDVLERIVTNEDAADALFEQVSTIYGLDSNEGLVDAVISEGYTGATVYDILSRYMGDNPSAKNTSLFLLQNGIDGIQYPAGTISGQTSPGVFNYVVFDENAVTIRNRIQFQSQQNRTQYQDLEGNPIEGQPITYPTEFGDLSYIRGENGDIIMVREPLAQTVEQEVNQAVRNRTSDGLVYRAAVEAINNGNEFILYAIDKPDLGSLVHEFMHVAEQDLDDGDLETLERWSGFTKGTTEFREQVADGFVKFISEGSPELNSINAIFNKIAKMLKALYKRVLASPLDIKLNDDVRIIYAKIAGVEQGFTKRLKQATESVQELSDSQRKELLKLSRSLKRYAPSQLSTGTQVVKKDGSIGVVGREDLSGTTSKDRAEGITELLTYPLLVDLAGLYETTNKITPYGKPGITPSCT